MARFSNIGHKTLRQGVKRSLDIAGAISGMAALAPLIVAVSLLVRWRLGSPVFFCQERAGFKGRLFKLIKFRTMTDARDPEGRLLPDNARLTSLGRWLRKTSLDELPELWNVLRGDMSLVGPRPLLSEYLPLYTPDQARRHDVRPGLTGLAQVEGRNSTSWERRLRQDVWYVDNACLKLDLLILVRTVLTVLSCRNVNASDHATMPRFDGDDKHAQDARRAA